MDWELIQVAFAIIMGIFIITLLWGVGKAWKTNNKFIAIVMLAMAVGLSIGFYAIYGKKFFG